MPFDFNKRHAHEGDMVIATEKDGSKCFGVVYKVKYDSHGHATCFLSWAPKQPKGYMPEYGIGRTNIHNLRSTYDVIKKKEA